MATHEHPIDGKLHDDCRMCTEIRRRIQRDKIDMASAETLRRYAALAGHGWERRLHRVREA